MVTESKKVWQKFSAGLTKWVWYLKIPFTHSQRPILSIFKFYFWPEYPFNQVNQQDTAVSKFIKTKLDTKEEILLELPCAVYENTEKCNSNRMKEWFQDGNRKIYNPQIIYLEIVWYLKNKWTTWYIQIKSRDDMNGWKRNADQNKTKMWRYKRNEY